MNFETVEYKVKKGDNLWNIVKGAGFPPKDWRKIYDAPYRILGITVSRPVAECLPRIRRFATEAARNVGWEIEIADEDIVVRDGFIGEGYGIPTKEGNEAIRLVARTDGLFLDPTYTGKTMAGLKEEIASGRITASETVIYVHTGSLLIPIIAHIVIDVIACFTAVLVEHRAKQFGVLPAAASD